MSWSDYWSEHAEGIESAERSRVATGLAVVAMLEAWERTYRREMVGFTLDFQGLVR